MVVTLRALRALLRIASIQARLVLGSPLLPGADRAFYQAKGQGLIALHWHGIAVDWAAGHGQATTALAAWLAARAAASADRALAALTAIGPSSGALHDALRSFAAHPERFAPGEPPA